MNKPTEEQEQELFRNIQEKFGNHFGVLTAFAEIIEIMDWEDVLLFVSQAPAGGTAVWEAYISRAKSLNVPSDYSFVNYAQAVVLEAKQQHIHIPPGNSNS